MATTDPQLQRPDAKHLRDIRDVRRGLHQLRRAATPEAAAAAEHRIGTALMRSTGRRTDAEGDSILARLARGLAQARDTGRYSALGDSYAETAARVASESGVNLAEIPALVQQRLEALV